jgi:EAL domain-containing protein (putative c-di-GMP-specific phosphodiesterase class I)
MAETVTFLERNGLDPGSTIIEIAEHQPSGDDRSMREALPYQSSMGCEIALDGLVAGNSGLRHWLELLPDYVKVDKHFIGELHEHPVKLNFV